MSRETALTYGSGAVLIVFAGVVVVSSFAFRPMEGGGSRFGSASLATVLPARVEPVESFSVNALFAGKIADVLVSVGADVRPGQKLMEISSDEATAEVQRARARAKVAQARLTAARAGARPNQSRLLEEQYESAKSAWKAHRERLETFSSMEAERAYADARGRLLETRQLFDKRLVSRAELDEDETRERAESRNLAAAQEHRSLLKQEVDSAASQTRLIEMQMHAPDGLEIQSAAADYADAKAVLALAEQRVTEQQITVKQAGTVLRIGVRPGEYVPAGARLLTIADLSCLSIEVPVSAAIAKQIQTGGPVVVRLPTDPPARVEAAISSITLVPDEVQRTYLVKVVIPNPKTGAVLAGLDGAVEFPHLKP